MQPYRVRLFLSVFFLVISAGPWSRQHLTAQRLDEALLDNLEYREIGPTRQSGRFVDISVLEKRITREAAIGVTVFISQLTQGNLGLIWDYLNHITLVA
jgi:hypothetical protein